jgi:hypothetical protein
MARWPRKRYADTSQISSQVTEDTAASQCHQISPRYRPVCWNESRAMWKIQMHAVVQIGQISCKPQRRTNLSVMVEEGSMGRFDEMFSVDLPNKS